MEMPVPPPELQALIASAIDDDSNIFLTIFSTFGPVDNKGRYFHWDKIRHLQAPEGFTNEQWWTGIKLAREKIYQDTLL